MMYALRTALSCLFVGFFFLSAHAQQPSDPIHRGAVNLAYLEHLVKIQVDSVRQTKGLPPLVNDSILYLASRDHASYLTHEKELSHEQPSGPKKTPQNRANFYGAKNYLTGENVLSYPLEDTYIATARRMVSGWVHSPGHYKNIITPYYQITGVSVLPHQKDGNFIAVQVFAKVLWKYTFESNKQLFVYDTSGVTTIQPTQNQHTIADRTPEKLPWKLKPLPYPHKPLRDPFPQTSRLLVEEGQLHLWIRDPLHLKKMLRHRKDGIVAEVVSYEPYHCGNPAYYTALSRRNHNSSINGQLLKPVYTKELLQELKVQEKAFKASQHLKLQAATTQAQKRRVKREKWQPSPLDVVLGHTKDIIPTGYQEINLLVLRKRQIVAPIYLTGFCGDLSFRDTIPSVLEFEDPDLEFPITRKRFSFSIPFARNDVQPDLKRMAAIRDTLLNYQIDSIDVLAYASVEGRNTKNTTLYQTRGNHIVSYLKQHIDTTTTVSVRSGENWNTFYGQLRQSSDYPAWKNLSKDSIRQKFQDSQILHRWDDRLNLQRTASVTIRAHDSVRDTLRYVQQNYLLSNNKQATARQNYYYQLWKQKRLPLDSLLAPVYPVRREYTQLLVNQLRLDYQQNSATWDEEKIQAHWKKLKAWLAHPGVGVEMSYYAAFFLLNHWHVIHDSFKTDRLGNVLKNMANHNQYKGSLQRMRATYALYMAPVAHQKGDYRQMQKYLDFAYEYYAPSFEIRLNAQRALQLSNYFIQLGEEHYAYAILDRYLTEAAFDVPVYSQYLKLAYTHPEYQQKSHYTELLIEARQKLTQNQWCNLFINDCGISFQVLDDEKLRNFYCQECAEYQNAATRPE